jgi:hypothetical protein
MNRYIVIRRLRGPAILLLVGIIALLNQMDILRWHHAWPLFLIVLGALLLAERAALAADGYPPPPAVPYAGYPYPGTPAQPNQAQPPGTAIVAAGSDDSISRGGQS